MGNTQIDTNIYTHVHRYIYLEIWPLIKETLSSSPMSYTQWLHDLGKANLSMPPGL